MGKYSKVFKEKSFYKAFLTSLLITGLGYGIYKGLIDNYMAEIVKMGWNYRKHSHAYQNNQASHFIHFFY